jgi:hypothetical protein
MTQSINERVAKALGLEIYQDANDLLGDCWVKCEPDDPICEVAGRRFTPATNLNQAIELLEGLRWQLKSQPDYIPEQAFHCYISKWGNGLGATPSEAIVKAFLNWKEKE